MIISEQEKNRIRKLHREYSIIKESIDDAKALEVARELHDSMEGAGTDEDAFWRITNEYASCCSTEIREAFKLAFGGKDDEEGRSTYFNRDKGDLRKWIEGDFTNEQPWWNSGFGTDLGVYDEEGKGREAALKAWGYIN